MMTESKVSLKLDYFIASKKIPNIIFHGESGSGKRTILNNFLYKIYCGDLDKMKKHIMTVECSHGKGIKFIREDLKFFAKSHIQSNQGSTFKSIVLLNADSLTIDAQSALRRCIELFSHNTRFFIVVENKERLLNPILSRFCEIYISGNKILSHSSSEDPMWDERSIALYQEILKRFVDNTPSYSDLIHTASDWCEQGYSCLDWIECIRGRVGSVTDATGGTVSEGFDNHILISMCFHKIKPDFRCEKMLMYYLLYFTFVSSKEELENILL
jgi:hypothetical protein